MVGKTADLKRMNLIMAGDMNELGGSDKGQNFRSDFFGLRPASDKHHLATCCADSNFSNRFDRLLANSPARPTANILTRITDTREITYPLDPNFSARPNEEHKAIFGVVEFAPRAKKAALKR